MRRFRRFQAVVGAAVVVAVPLLVGQPAAGSSGPVLATQPAQPPSALGKSRFAQSGSGDSGAQRAARDAPSAGSGVPAAATSPATVTAGANVNMVGANDVTQQATINGVDVKTCNPGKETAQNETPIAVNPTNGSDLVAGANDYRLYEPSENRYDGAGGFYQSTDGGQTWSAGFLPGLVRANATAPGPYESAGDPAIAAGPGDAFWYSTLDINRSDGATAVAVSHSTDGGATWSTNFVVQTPAAAGATLSNDKDWVASDQHFAPADPLFGKVAYTTWTQFHTTANGTVKSSIIVISKTTDGGTTWSAPTRVSPTTFSQGSVVQVDGSGHVHIVYETFSHGRDVIAHSVSTNGGATFSTQLLAVDHDVPDPLPGGTYRTNSFPAFSLAGSVLHVVWSDWNGTNAHVVYIRSTNAGTTWSKPAAISGSTGDQFFPWVSAGGSTVYAGWFDRATPGDTYGVTATGSPDSGSHWASPAAVSTAMSSVATGNLFDFPNCLPDFIGDYSGMSTGPDGIGHMAWTDIRADSPSETGGSNQEPFTATLNVG